MEDVPMPHGYESNAKTISEQIQDAINYYTEQGVYGIKIPGYTNEWSAIDDYVVGNKHYFLMENDTWGDETWYLVITKDFKEIYETYDDIESCLIDEDII